MFKPIKWRTTIIFAIFSIVSPFVMMITNNFLSFMLGFNIFLAYIPLYLIWLIIFLLEKTSFKIKYYHILLFLLFILFLPNTFYVITDAIHINSTLFYTKKLYTPETYLRNISAYLMLAHIIFAILLGLYAGAESFVQVYYIFKRLQIKKHLSNIIFAGIIILSSIGIYIGRFLRFFSWDILNPVRIVSELLTQIDIFFLLFILLFSSIQYVVYYGYNALRIHGKDN